MLRQPTYHTKLVFVDEVPPRSKNICKTLILAAEKKKMSDFEIKSDHPLLKNFELSTDCLRKVSAAMVRHMEMGLAFDYAENPTGPDGKAESDKLPLMMLPSYVNRLPTGEETGTFLAIDLGGTNLRVCAITLLNEGNPHHVNNEEEIVHAKMSSHSGEHTGTYSTINRHNHRCFQAHYRIPEEVKQGTKTELCDFIAKMTLAFLADHNVAASEKLRGLGLCAEPLIPAGKVSDEFTMGPIPTSLGFTFSFPVRQKNLRESSLLQWTKGFTASGAVGEDIGLGVEESLRKLIPPETGIDIKLNALINDTVGTLLAHAFDNPTTAVGVILGTGTNAAYVERRGNITKLPLGPGEHPGDRMIINTEWGAFHEITELVPKTQADKEIDATSVNRGKHFFEKMISGMYLGEVAARTMAQLIDEPDVLLFGGTKTELGKQMKERFTQKNGLPTKFLQKIEEVDESVRTKRAREVFAQDMGVIVESEDDCMRICEVIKAVKSRAARLSAAAIFALLNKMGLPNKEDICVAIDGTLWLKYPNFKKHLVEALRELMPADKFDLLSLENALDGSGMGAAVVAAVYEKH